MRVWVVTRAPADRLWAYEFVGVFRSLPEAEASVHFGAGTYTIAEMEVGRRYASGDVRNIVVIEKVLK